MTAKDMKLRDVVKLRAGSPYSHSTVIAVTNEAVTLFRPYVHVADFEIGKPDGGERVIPYIGMETYDVWLSSAVEYELVDRQKQ